MFIRDFGLEPEKNEAAWIAYRNPITNISSIRSDLPVFILQGTKDLRVSLNDGLHMANALENNGNSVTYLEVQGGDHCLANQPDRMSIITNWLENESFQESQKECPKAKGKPWISHRTALVVARPLDFTGETL